MGKANPNVCTRIPPDWKTEIERIARSTGRKPSQVFYEAIALYLDKDRAATMANELKDVARRLDLLEQQLGAMRVLMSR